MNTSLEGLYLWSVKTTPDVADGGSLWVITRNNDFTAAATKAIAFVRRKLRNRAVKVHVENVSNHGTIDV